MGYAKLSVTIPDKMYKEIKELASKENIKISHIVSDALAEKTKKMKPQRTRSRKNNDLELGIIHFSFLISNLRSSEA